ncbi:unnamed protein product [Adineta steineri]|uniref:Uncharacterized protein n=1 Tax=Adineta steineri TaxID=433720 RepID=A0A814KBL5_9BILA|nr:unnamed protein product [Adineta steineri]CAF1081870.1 unnamed protein product [Adineta steineri]
MGCNTSTTAVAPTTTVQPTKTAHSTMTVHPTKTIQPTITHESNKKDDAHLMYSQLFKEFLSQMSENDRSTVISFCPDLYTNDNLSDLISTNPELLNRTNIMRKKLIDENPTVSMGRLMLEMGSYDRAEYLYFKAIHQEKNNWKRLTVVYNNLANVYYKEGKYDKALTYYHKSLSIQQKHLPENDSSLSIDYNNIAIVYETQKNYDLSLQFFQSALMLEMKASKPDEKLIAFLNNHIGLIHNEQQNFAQGTSGSANNQLSSPQGIALDSSTNTLYISDTGNNRVMRYLSGASSGDIVVGGNGELNGPRGLYYDVLSNSILIANANAHNILRWVYGANSSTLVAGDSNGLSGNTSLLLDSPKDVKLDSMGNVYVADEDNKRIQFFLSGQVNGTTIAGVNQRCPSRLVICRCRTAVC